MRVPVFNVFPLHSWCRYCKYQALTTGAGAVDTVLKITFTRDSIVGQKVLALMKKQSVGNNGKSDTGWVWIGMRKYLRQKKREVITGQEVRNKVGFH